MYLAVLVYPKNIKKRTDFVNVCRAWWCKGESGRFNKGQIHNPDITRFSESADIQREFDRATRILIKKRQMAGNIAKMSLLNEIIPVRIGHRKFSLNAIIKSWIGRHSTGNIKSATDKATIRVWSESLPVVHLMMGLHCAMESLFDKKQMELEDLLQDTRWVKEAVKEAEKIRIFAAQTQRNASKRYPLNASLMISVTIKSQTL